MPNRSPRPQRPAALEETHGIGETLAAELQKAARPSAEHLPPGTRVADFVIHAQLGAGAFGTVYEARHTLIGKMVAIKVLSRAFSTQADTVSRFVAEARAVNEIGHPHIIDIFSFGRLSDGRPYHVMELLRGETLRDRLVREAPLPLGTALALLEPIARALAAAHGAGIVHRDLKPANVFLHESDEGLRPKLLDFGIARHMARPDSVDHKTMEGEVVGTPAYMAPEQCVGRAVDHRADIYSFGVMAYEMLTGRLPFEGESARSLMMAHLSEPVPVARDAALPSSTMRVLELLMSKSASVRPASITHAFALLSGKHSTESLAALPEPARAAPRRTPLPRAVWAALGIAAVALVLLAFELVRPPVGPALLTAEPPPAAAEPPASVAAPIPVSLAPTEAPSAVATPSAAPASSETPASQRPPRRRRPRLPDEMEPWEPGP